MRRISLAVLLMLCLITAGCGGKNQKLIRLAGSTAFLPFAEKLAEIYMKDNPGINIDVQGGGSAMGIMAVTQGIVDIGMADMLKLPKEADPFEKVIVAKDGIAVIVSGKNPLNGLSLSQLRTIFSGQVKNWKEVGGQNAPIRVISREEGSGTRKSFDKIILDKIRLTPDAMFQDSNGTIREAVKSDTDSIGYISIGFLAPGVKALSIDGIAASNQNVVKGIYKLSRPVFFILRSNPSALTKDFVKFMLGDKAQKIIAQDGLISIK